MIRYLLGITLIIISIFNLKVLSASATQITYTFTGTGSGVIGGKSFNNKTFIITAISDTDSVRPGTANPDANLTSVLLGSISIPGVDDATINISSNYLRVNSLKTANPPYVSFGIFVNNAPTNYLYVANNACASYDLKYSIGPLTSDLMNENLSSLQLANFKNIPTSSGSLSFSDISNLRFTAVGGLGPAIRVPIMEGWWLIPGALAGLGIFARRKKN